MPRIVEYPVVLRHMLDRKMRSLYHNSGAFGFDPAVATHTIGWIGPPDPTIRPAARSLARQIPPPFAENLARLTCSAWNDIGGPAWLMPMSHWSYELEFGNPDWLPVGLKGASIGLIQLVSRNQADAIEFLTSESAEFSTMTGHLFQHLANSDFVLAFPDRPILATLHHHRQVWWTSTDAELIAELGKIKKMRIATDKKSDGPR